MNVLNATIQTGKATVYNNEKTENTKNNISFNKQKKSEDELIGKLKEMMKKISENDNYDDDTKKMKIKELEKQIADILKLRKEQEAEALKRKEESKKDNNSDIKKNKDGDILELGGDTQSFLKAEADLKKVKDSFLTKSKLEYSASFLEYEIEMDKGRGVDTTKKDTQLSEIKDNIEGVKKDIPKMLKNVGETVKEIKENNEINEVDEKETADKNNINNDLSKNTNMSKDKDSIKNEKTEEFYKHIDIAV